MGIDRYPIKSVNLAPADLPVSTATLAALAGKQRQAVADVREFGALGNGVTDDRAAIQAAIDSLGTLPGSVVLPVTSGAYMVSGPVVFRNGQNIMGLATSGSSSGSVTLKALPSFTGSAVLESWSYSHGDWWHWGSISNFRIDCAGVAAAGVAIHQMGETSLLERLNIGSAADSCVILTGSHAPATLRQVTVNSAVNYGVKLTAHPGAFAADGNNGVVNLIGLSGDHHPGGHIYSNGSHKIIATALKSEGCDVGVLLTGSGSGGSATTLVLNGYVNGLTPRADVVRISGTARPQLHLLNLRQANYTNMINDQVQTRVVPVAAPFTFEPTNILYNGTTLLDTEIVLGQEREIKVRRTDTGNLHTILQQTTDLVVHVKGVSGPGVRIDDSAGTKLAQFGSTNGVELAASGGKVGFYGATAIVRPSGTPAAATDAATTMALVNDLRTKLIALGLIA